MKPQYVSTQTGPAYALRLPAEVGYTNTFWCTFTLQMCLHSNQSDVPSVKDKGPNMKDERPSELRGAKSRGTT